MSSPKFSAGSDSHWTIFGICIFLAAITWLVFSQTLGHEFVNYDDELYVADNPVVLGGLNLKGIVWAFTHNVNVNWTPLTVISHMLDCQLYGINAGWHHLTSVLLHMASVIVLFLVLKAMTSALWRSAFVAAVFAIHPLHVESVAWIAERRDVLSGLFFMLTLGAYVGYVRHPWSLGRYLTVALMLALGLMSKPVVVTLPFVLLLLDYWPLKRFPPPDGHFSVPWRLITEKIPLLALSGADCVVTLFAQKEAIMSLPLSVRIGNALVSYVAYMKQMIYPVGLAVYYPPLGSGLALWKTIAAFVLLLVIFAGAVAAWRNRPWFLFGWLWYLGMLVPTIGLIQSGLRAQADRYTYLPQIGLYVLLTWAVADLCAGWRHRRVVLGGIGTVILIALIFCAHAQTSYWKNSESLWVHTLNCTSNNDEACYGLGNALSKKGQVDEAIIQFQKALAINPGFANVHYNLGNVLLQKGQADEAIIQFQKALAINPDLTEAHYNLGNILLQKRRANEAIIQFQKALAINPDFIGAHYNLGGALLQQGRADEAIIQFKKVLAINADFAGAHYNLGNVLLQKGQTDEAIAHYQTAIEINPDYAEAHNNLGNALVQKGQIDGAMAHYQTAIEIRPDYANAHYNLGNILLQKKRVDEAIIQFQRTLAIQPGFVEAQRALSHSAWILATSPDPSVRDGMKAVELAQQADQLSGRNNPMMVAALAAADAEVGRFPEAVASARRALQLAAGQNNAALVAALEAQLKLYQVGSPFRDTGTSR